MPLARRIFQPLEQRVLKAEGDLQERLRRDLQNELDAVRTQTVDSRHELEREWRNFSAGDAIGHLERVQKDSEEPRDDVEVDDLERRAGVGVINLGDDPTLLVSVSDEITRCVKRWRLQDPEHF